ncbi:MAG TPA: zf-HC2 domain-containing protein [Candidatus Limnocylindrales bacterium]|nr:zf-HC2 domain-containing protein [Candidatus Limnocylindrales bacterium]
MKSDFQVEACPQYEAKFEDYVCGELSGAEKREIEEHLKSCAGCTAAVRQAEASTRLLRLMEAAPGPGPAFARVVMARIRSQRDAMPEPRGLWQSFVSLAWRFAASTALILVLMVTYDVTRHENSGPTVASVRQREVHDLFTSDRDRVPTSRDDVLIMVAEQENGK